jgi:hypothetical protein
MYIIMIFIMVVVGIIKKSSKSIFVNKYVNIKDFIKEHGILILPDIL